MQAHGRAYPQQVSISISGLVLDNVLAVFVKALYMPHSCTPAPPSIDAVPLNDCWLLPFSHTNVQHSIDFTVFEQTLVLNRSMWWLDEGPMDAYGGSAGVGVADLYCFKAASALLVQPINPHWKLMKGHVSCLAWWLLIRADRYRATEAWGWLHSRDASDTFADFTLLTAVRW